MALIFLCVAAVFAVLWFGFEWIGGLAGQDEPEPELHAGGGSAGAGRASSPAWQKTAMI